MAKKQKRPGRVTPKGTANPTPKKKTPKAPPGKVDTTMHLPGKVNRPQGRASRPISHNRGNR
jgi:hypothetical protein